jgi:hypothetical protein
VLDRHCGARTWVLVVARQLRPPAEMRSAGQAQLWQARLQVKAVDMESAITIGHTALAALLAGKRRPTDDERQRIASAYGIAADTWDRPHGQAPWDAPASVAPAELVPGGYLVDEASGVTDEIFEAIEGNRAGGARIAMFSNPTRPAEMRSADPTTLEGCNALLAKVRKARDAVGVLPQELIKLADSETRILTLRARLEQQAEMLEDRVVREHPQWQLVRRAIAGAICPKCTKAVIEALDRLKV